MKIGHNGLINPNSSSLSVSRKILSKLLLMVPIMDRNLYSQMFIFSLALVDQMNVKWTCFSPPRSSYMRCSHWLISFLINVERNCGWNQVQINVKLRQQMRFDLYFEPSDLETIHVLFLWSAVTTNILFQISRCKRSHQLNYSEIRQIQRLFFSPG